jgi:thiamine pyrophosphate-dependent acetolactate synthase large subunit-like protein
VIHLDVDRSETGRSHGINVGIDVGILGSVGRHTRAEMRAEKSNIRQASSKYTKTAMSLKSLPSSFEHEPLKQSPGHAHPYHAVKQILDSLEPDAIVYIDSGKAG